MLWQWASCAERLNYLRCIYARHVVTVAGATYDGLLELYPCGANLAILSACSLSITGCQGCSTEHDNRSQAHRARLVTRTLALGSDGCPEEQMHSNMGASLSAFSSSITERARMFSGIRVVPLCAWSLCHRLEAPVYTWEPEPIWL